MQTVSLPKGKVKHLASIYQAHTQCGLFIAKTITRWGFSVNQYVKSDDLSMLNGDPVLIPAYAFKAAVHAHVTCKRCLHYFT